MSTKSPHQNVLINLPDKATDRKQIPLMTGLLDYFPAALAAVASVSKKGNDQHNPGEPLHWARHKSTDQADTIVRHLMQRGTIDSDGTRHSAKAAWRALALLQEEIEVEAGFKPTPPKTPAESFVRRILREYEEKHGPGSAIRDPEIRDLIRHGSLDDYDAATARV